MITFESLRGYVLEELLAWFLYANGYRLLVSEEQDPAALTRGAQGLLVRGRGADHQADVLGELTLPVPFSLPLRLFVEAKYRRDSAGLQDVRNAHGVVHDVNEHYATASAGSRTVPVRRYHYRYTLFSANGFTKPAQRYALAQQISLVDLSNPAFNWLLKSADETAHELHELTEDENVKPFPRGQVRTALRLTLGTWTNNSKTSENSAIDRPDEHQGLDASTFNPAQREGQELPDDALARVATNLRKRTRNSIIFGFPPTPFSLALHADDPSEFSSYVADNGPDIRVNIESTRQRQVTKDWTIVPTDEPRGFRLRFALPSLLEDWLLRDPTAAAIRARDVEADLLSSVAVFHEGQLIRLLYSPRRRG